MITICLSILAVITAISGERRNMSEIRYHFTPCGTMGRLGPSYEDCYSHYASIGSPIIRDHVLTDTYSSRFAGSQSFRPPRDTAWNITLAGAAGGRGLCNTDRGRGLVQYLASVRFDSEDDLIIVAGQKGLGPCDTTSPDPGHGLCENPPQTLEESENCQFALKRYNSTGDSYEIEYFSGGAGGGGASYIGRRAHYSQFDGIIAISAGGGGTGLVNPPNITLDDDDYINAKPTTHDDLSLYGGRGYRVVGAEVSAGAGGGYSESLYSTLQIVSMDGRALNMSSNFARGGTHCLAGNNDVPEQLQGAMGGFGGGGGGCLEGGGGGGFTGGDLMDFTEFTPGSGGFSFNAFTENFAVEGNFSLNDGDGYVDIVPADCGCVYECVVFEEDDQFQCHCPNGTNLAPDLSDCYSDDERNVTVETIVVPDVNEEFTLTAITFETSFFIFSVDVGLSTEQLSVKRDAVTTDGDICVLVFIGEDDDIVLVSNPILGGGKATSLSRIMDNGTLATTTYAGFLDSPVFVTGAVLASTGACSIEDMISFNTSIRNITSEDEANFTKIAINFYNTSCKYGTFVRQLLNISEENDAVGNGEENDVDRDTTALSNGVIVAIILVSLIVVGTTVAIIVSLLLWLRRSASNSSKSHAVENGQEKVVMLISHKRQSSMRSNPGYEVVDIGEYEELTSDVDKIPSINGVNSTAFDFTDFNKARNKTEISDWEYPRTNLVFMRDLGEGQFGKVMLMKATTIAGCSGDIPVAVKTLGSRDPAIIKKFMEETELMQKFTHPNIISLLGVCNMSVKDDSAPLMILEYMPYGDLHGFLAKHRPTEEKSESLISENHFYNFATDVAQALDFLSSQKFVHRDVAARNCLVGANLHIKIADFGLARGMYDKDYYRVAGRSFLPVRWMAPECLLYGVFATASDVWAYGVLLWEITSYGLTPLNEYEPHQVVDMALDDSLKHIQPATCPEALYSIMCQCHAHKQEKRPSFSQLLQLLATHTSSRTN